MKNLDELIDLAFEYRKRAYTPYSNFKVGSVVVTENNRIFGGCNIEISSYSPTICAERTAIFKAISEGEKRIDKIIVAGPKDFTFPCGVCRQVLTEFADKNCEIIVVDNSRKILKFTLEELLPYSFSKDDLRR